MGDEEQTESRDEAYAQQVGARLRSIRRQKRLSLQEVEASSGQEFKASVLGAYERGERAISVPRLQRLAQFYRVPVDQLLPGDDAQGRRNEDDTVIDLTEGRQRAEDRPLKLDLAAVDRASGPEGEMLARYVRMIQVQRGDYNGRVLTIRSDDLRSLACILDVAPDRIAEHLEQMQLTYVPAPAAPVRPA